MSQGELELEPPRLAFEVRERCDGSGLIREDAGKAHEYARRCPRCCDHPEGERVETPERRFPSSWGGGRARRGIRVNCRRCGAVVALPCIVVRMSQPARYRTINFPVTGDPELVTTGQGNAMNVAGWTNKAIQVQGTGWTATFTLQQRIKGGAWQNIAAATAVDQTNIGDIIALADDVEEIRMDVTAATVPDASFAVPLIGIDHGRGF